MESIVIRIDVALGKRTYPILIGNGLLSKAGAHLGSFAKSDRLVVVSDENVWAAQSTALTAGLKGIKVQSILLPPGESSKDWATLATLMLLASSPSRLKDLRVTRFAGGTAEISRVTGWPLTSTRPTLERKRSDSSTCSSCSGREPRPAVSGTVTAEMNWP